MLRISIISGAISATGDILLQVKEGLRDPERWNARQTANIAAFRCVHGPLVDACWRWFDVRLPYAGAMRGAVLRALTDQIVLMPPSLVSFFVAQGLLEGLSIDDSFARVTDSFVPTAQIALPFWTFVHTITFSAFPTHLRMPFAQCAAVIWNALASEQNQIARRRERERRDARCEEAIGCARSM